MSLILQIGIDAPLRRTFDYLPPPGIAETVLCAGQRLWVPFGRRRVVGILLRLSRDTSVPSASLRAAFSVIDSEPTLEQPLLSVLRWAADYYRHPIGEVIAAALPAALRRGAAIDEPDYRWALTDKGREQALQQISQRATRLRPIVELLARAEQVDAETIAGTGEHWRAALRNLERRGYIARTASAQQRVEAPTANAATGPALSDAQEAAVARIIAGLHEFDTILLHGVTGSGKTEVYLRAIEEVVRRGRQALVLVPEISLTPQLVRRFAARFCAPLAVLHSSLSESQRLSSWRAARAGVAPIVIGTRSAVFAPLGRPGLIVVDEEHDPSYKQQEGFHYSARDLAIVRAQRLGIPVILGSATPSLESLARVRRQRGTLLELPQRAGSATAPHLSLVDLRRHAARDGISTPVLLAIERHLRAGGQVLVYLNRRGYAPVLFCPGCGWSAPCRRCDARMTVHRGRQRLTCHHCGLESTLPEQCPQCAAAVKPVGQGTERIEETLAALYPDYPLARIDRDAVRRRGELESALADVDSGRVRLLVGTQMLTKGHDFPGVTLVVVLNADQGLFGTDFRAAERLAQTIVQVAGRAGRAERPGEVLIQTEYPEHPLLGRLLAGGYDAFAEAALREREQSGWPPFSRLVLLRAEAPAGATAFGFLDAARSLAAAHQERGVKLLGPAPAPMEKRAGRFRAQLLLQASTHAPLQRLMRAWLPEVEALPQVRKVRWSVDVDPLELF